MLAVTGPEDGFEPDEDSSIPTRVQAAVPMYPGRVAGMDRDHVMFRGKLSEMPDLYRAAAPINHLDKGDAPMLILHGTADTGTPVAGSVRFAEKLQETGIEHELVLVEGAPHSFDLQPAQRDLRALVVAFFDKHLKKAQP
jgi:dipeptidyl aminopeptidase/acylaminoacyl peptidase